MAQPDGSNSSSGVSTPDVHQKPDVQIEVDTLIIGAGPAGAALACFLASHGIKGLMVSKSPTNADTPRAHITNAAAFEALRDIGLDDELTRLATKGNCMVHTRWCYSMAGREYARIYSWGNDPARKGDYERASPCRHVDLPQTLLEPVLVRYAALNGITCRFDTDFVSFTDEGTHVVTTLRDRLTRRTYAVRSRFLFGADGARSRVQQQLGLPLVKKPQQGLAINVLVKADLSHLMDSRPGNLHWVFQAEKEHPAFAWQAIVRMVKPWHEWMFIMLPDPAADPAVAVDAASNDQYLARVRELIGDGTPAEILDVSKWWINEVYAESYSSGNVFCLGDAVHRHPPFNGLGSNTCIQDAFNLAWKVAYVLRGRADRDLLDSYSAERQPVGARVVTRANDGFREHFNVWAALGLNLPDPAERAKAIAELEAATPSGRERRERLQHAVAQTCHEFHALGIEMNQNYAGSSAVVTEGVSGDDGFAGVDDLELTYVPSTFPGRRLPHVWLSRAVPDGLVSTIDLAGKGRFTLFTGIGGGLWKRAARKSEEVLGVEIRVVEIGYGLEYEDPYFEWARMRGVQEDGCVLVRPDRFVAWRADGVVDGAEEKLVSVLTTVLAR